jgi:hypothetical protein
MSLSHRYADLELESALLALLDSSMSTALEQTSDFPSEETATVKRLAKIGLKSESFAREALELARINEELIPRGLDLDRLERTIQNRDAIRARLIKAQLLVQRLQALSVLLGVDSYSDALDIYQALKRHGTDQSLREAVKDLGKIFKRGRKKEEESAGEPAGSQTSAGANAAGSGQVTAGVNGAAPSVGAAGERRSAMVATESPQARPLPLAVAKLSQSNGRSSTRLRSIWKELPIEGVASGGGLGFASPPGLVSALHLASPPLT